MTALTPAQLAALAMRQSRKYNRLMDRGAYAEAISFAIKLKGPTGYPRLYDQLRAAAFTDAGLSAIDRPTIERGISMWNDMITEASTPALRTNRANAKVNVLWCAVRSEGWSEAWSNSRRLLGEARAEYLEVAEDDSLKPEQRLRALVNAGNSYDEFARHVEAIELYDRALTLNPDFGMAQGNKGMALLRLAPYVRGHQPAVLRDAEAHLAAAVRSKSSVIENGGQDALNRFQTRLVWVQAKLGKRRDESSDGDPITDPYGRWSLRHDLLLHPSPTCLTSNTPEWDPLFFRSIPASLESGFEVPTQFATFNVLKSEYAAARWLAWIGTEETAITPFVALNSSRTRFVDTLDYSSYDLFCSLTLQAFQAANNLLDKLAGFLGLHLGLPVNPTSVYFRRWWADPKRKPAQIDAGHLVEELDRPNLGLWALVDLSNDFDSDGRYRRLQHLRHAATHRFVVAHREGAKPASTALIEHVRWKELKGQVVRQLQLSRAALFYLARAVDGGAAASRSTGPMDVPKIQLPSLPPYP